MRIFVPPQQGESEELYLAISCRKQHSDYGGGYEVGIGAYYEDFKKVGHKQSLLANDSFHAEDYKDAMFNVVMSEFITKYPAKKIFLIVDKFINSDGKPDYKMKIELQKNTKMPTFADMLLIGKSN